MNEYLYVGSGDLERDGLIFNKYDTPGNWVGHWGVRGSGPQQSFCCWGVDVAPPEEPPEDASIITTDWFCCRIQKWTLNGAWTGTIQNSLRSDAQSFKCKNKSGQNQTLYQRVYLEAGSYTVQFLAFTNGEQVTNSDVEPYGPGDPTGEYQNYWLTTITNDPNNPNDDEHLWACRVSATFTVGASGSYDIGAEVKAAKTVYIASLTCFRN